MKMSLKKLFSMVDDRNITVHTYNERSAEKLFGRLDRYVELMRKVVNRLKEKSKELWSKK